MAIPTLELSNQTAADITYASIGLTVPANGMATVTGVANKQIICGDAALHADVVAQNMNVNDGTNDHALGDGLAYLNFVAQEVGNFVGPHLNFKGQTVSAYRQKFLNITGNATTTVKHGIGILLGVMINNNNGGGTATLYDSLTATGTKIATMTFGSGGGLLGAQQDPSFIGPLGIELANGLTVVTAGATTNDVTILYQ